METRGKKLFLYMKGTCNSPATAWGKMLKIYLVLPNLSPIDSQQLFSPNNRGRKELPEYLAGQIFGLSLRFG